MQTVNQICRVIIYMFQAYLWALIFSSYYGTGIRSIKRYQNTMTCELEFYFAHNFINFTSYAFNFDPKDVKLVVLLIGKELV